ncbi:phage holin family protein [Flavihumibacter sp.]|uniref:phage holin family protein n=1 Tax=Flavihumibacter sp. TaxID=1913981 RepID=UPI002FC60DBF|nr:phage holin family protein [Flavihumibacter sediminis]
MNFLIRLLITAIVAFGLSYLLPGIQMDSFVTAIILAIVLAILNTLIKPLLVLLTLPITIITLGIFLLVINALIILLADKLVDGFHTDGFWTALLFSIVLSVTTSLITSVSTKD